MSLSRNSGVYEPADLDLLQRVFDRLCKERRLALKDRDQREYLPRKSLKFSTMDLPMRPSCGDRFQNFVPPRRHERARRLEDMATGSLATQKR